MENLQSFKTKGMESFTNLIDRGKEQPEEVKAWGLIAGSGVAGALAVTAGAKGLLAVVGLLANPPVALAVGAIGGGALGWSYIQKQAQAAEADNVSAEPLTFATKTDAAATEGTSAASAEAHDASE